MKLFKRHRGIQAECSAIQCQSQHSYYIGLGTIFSMPEFVSIAKQRNREWEQAKEARLKAKGMRDR